MELLTRVFAVLLAKTTSFAAQNGNCSTQTGNPGVAHGVENRTKHPQIGHSAVFSEAEPDPGGLDASPEFHHHRHDALERMLSGMMVHIGRESEPGLDIEKGS